MKTINFRNDPIYKAKTVPEVVRVPDMLFVMVDGAGQPEGNPMFQEAMQILYGIIYTIKFWDKKHTPPPHYAKFSLTPLEALWWMKQGKDFDPERPDEWRWTVMIRVPEFVTPEFFKQVVDELIVKKQSDIYQKARLEYLHEGEVVQLMHIGPYNAEESDITKLKKFASKAGYRTTGKHHELYFNDPRRTKPENLKTILRHSVSSA